MNKYRKYITSGVGFTFVVVGLTGVMFKFFFKNHALEEIHGWIGIGMVAAAIIHILQNWRPLQNHLRDWRVFLIIIPIVLVIVSVAAASGPAGPKMNPGKMLNRLSKASANDLARALGEDVTAVLASMKKDGLQVGSADESIKELAARNRRPPDAIFSYFLN